MTRVLTVSILLVLLAACASSPPLPVAQPVDYERYEEMSKPANGTIYNGFSGLAYVEDIRARRVGDILIVRLSERTDAKKESDTNISKNNATTITNPILAGKPNTINRTSNLNFDLDSEHAFEGKSDSSQSNELNGTIAVTVTRVLPGGNLVIEGEKWLTINSGREFIRLRGIVRPVDIAATNTVLSSVIANADITYSGTGETADSNRMGWLSRFFMGPIWPF